MQNVFQWNRFRSTDVRIEVYETVEFAVDVTDTNASYDLMDAATFGTKVYEVCALFQIVVIEQNYVKCALSYFRRWTTLHLTRCQTL